MRFRVAQQRGLSNAQSPFRVVEQSGREVDWVNRYLDQQRVRGVADSTLRSYAHDLLHFLRWWATAHKTSSITKDKPLPSQHSSTTFASRSTRVRRLLPPASIVE